MRGLVIIGFFAILIMAIIAGCAASGDSTPVVPDASGSLTNLNDSASCGQCSHRYSWGLYEIFIDPVTLEADVVPMRIAEGHLNALKFLEVYPCDWCIALTKVVLVEPKRFDVDVQLRHPFQGKHVYTGFDVHGIVMFDPSFTFESSGLSFPDPEAEGLGALLNPDGYTTLFNPTDYPPGVEQFPAWEYQVGRLATQEFPGSTLNPYKSFQTDTPRHHFACNTCDTQTYQIRFPETGPLRFGYAIDASWAPPLEDPPDVPDDFPPEANMPEPYFVSMTVIANTLWSQEGAGGGGDIRFLLKVYDHQDPHHVDDGGTIHSFRWEIDGMTGWDAISPTSWSEGSDSTGDWVSFLFHEAPVPDSPGLHRCVIGIYDTETGIKGFPECAYVVTEIYVNEGESCWSPGVMISDIPSENRQSHLNNAHNTYVDDMDVFHLYYLDYEWKIHHLTIDDGIIEDEVILPDDTGYNLNAIPDDESCVHLLYANDPDIQGGEIIYRKIDPDGVIGPAATLNASVHEDQFQTTLAIAPNGQIVAVWQDCSHYPNRRLCGAWYNGENWSPEMTLDTGYLPDNWIDPNVVVDSSSLFHIIYTNDTPANLYYMQFDDGAASEPESILITDWESSTPTTSIDSNDVIYVTFEDLRDGRRGWFTMRDPDTGIWTEEVDLVGYRHYNNRYQNQPLPDGRLAVIWTDRRDQTRGLYSKVFDPFITEAEIQAIADDEVDAAFEDAKNQTRLCIDSHGTLHLVWSDNRENPRWDLYYATCTP